MHQSNYFLSFPLSEILSQSVCLTFFPSPPLSHAHTHTLATSVFFSFSFCMSLFCSVSFSRILCFFSVSRFLNPHTHIHKHTNTHTLLIPLSLSLSLSLSPFSLPIARSLSLISLSFSVYFLLSLPRPPLNLFLFFPLFYPSVCFFLALSFSALKNFLIWIDGVNALVLKSDRLHHSMLLLFFSMVLKS